MHIMQTMHFMHFMQIMQVMQIMQIMQNYKIMHFMQIMQNMQGYKIMQIMHFMQGAKKQRFSCWSAAPLAAPCFCRWQRSLFVPRTRGRQPSPSCRCAPCHLSRTRERLT